MNFSTGDRKFSIKVKEQREGKCKRCTFTEATVYCCGDVEEIHLPKQTETINVYVIAHRSMMEESL